MTLNIENVDKTIQNFAVSYEIKSMKLQTLTCNIKLYTLRSDFIITNIGGNLLQHQSTNYNYFKVFVI